MPVLTTGARAVAGCSTPGGKSGSWWANWGRAGACATCHIGTLLQGLMVMSEWRRLFRATVEGRVR